MGFIKHFIAFTFLFIGSNSHAGLIELSYSLSLTDSSFDTENYTKTVSNTASFAWYFTELSAIEFSYSKGEQKLSASNSASSSPSVFRTDFELYGADLVFSLAKRDSAFQPYIKGGAAWVTKKQYREATPLADEELIAEVDGEDPVPSVGIGFKLMLFKNIRLKTSYDRWRSGKDAEGDTWDSRLNAGISFYL